MRALLIAVGLTAAILPGPATAKSAEQRAQDKAEKVKQKAEVQRLADRPITCNGKEDCDVKWSRALKWILDHCSYRISSQSDMMISTFGPDAYSPSPAYSISKLANGGDSYTFDFRGGCANIFGCQPNLVQAKADFSVTVLGNAD